MKASIHPKYHTKVVVSCSCGAIFQTGSTQEILQTEICSQCHPIYTGKKKTVDTTGRVDRFKKMTAKAEKKRELNEKTKKAKQKREVERVAKAQEGERKTSKKKAQKAKKEESK